MHTEDLATGTSWYDHEQQNIDRLTAYTGTMVAANAVETDTGSGLITHLINGYSAQNRRYEIYAAVGLFHDTVSYLLILLNLGR